MSDNNGCVSVDAEGIAEGFRDLDRKLIARRPPQIRWGPVFLGIKSDPKKRGKHWDDKDRIEWLQKFSRTMNHAAHLIQSERNELGRLCKLKEQQLHQMQEAVDRNNKMLQSQVLKMNEDRQEFLKAIAELKADVRRLTTENAEMEFGIEQCEEMTGLGHGLTDDERKSLKHNGNLD